MATKAPPAEELSTGERVVVRNDLPGLPAGTEGVVTFVAGFTWIRYWVRFENGVVRGSLNRKNLARPNEWKAIVERRERGEDDAAAGSTGEAEAATEADGGAAEAADESRIVNGVAVPSHLLERSRARREALGV